MPTCLRRTAPADRRRVRRRWRPTLPSASPAATTVANMCFICCSPHRKRLRGNRRSLKPCACQVLTQPLDRPGAPAAGWWPCRRDACSSDGDVRNRGCRPRHAAESTCVSARHPFVQPLCTGPIGCSSTTAQGRVIIPSTQWSPAGRRTECTVGRCARARMLSPPTAGCAARERADAASPSEVVRRLTHPAAPRGLCPSRSMRARPRGREARWSALLRQRSAPRRAVGSGRQRMACTCGWEATVMRMSTRSAGAWSIGTTRRQQTRSGCHRFRASCGRSSHCHGIEAFFVGLESAMRQGRINHAGLSSASGSHESVRSGCDRVRPQ